MYIHIRATANLSLKLKMKTILFSVCLIALVSAKPLEQHLAEDTEETTPANTEENFVNRMSVNSLEFQQFVTFANNELKELEAQVAHAENYVPQVTAQYTAQMEASANDIKELIASVDAL